MSAASRPQAMRTRPSTGARPVGSTSHQPFDNQTSKMAWKSGGFSWCAKALTARAGMPEARARLHENDLIDGSIVIGVSPRSDEDAQHIETEWHSQSLNH
mgnify:CR=1 FL=1